MCDLIKSFSLRDRAGEAVEDVSVFAVVLLKSAFHKTDDYLVGDERTCVDILFSLDAERCALFDVASENIARGNVGNFIFLTNQSGLSAFTCAGSA